jgi:hypothetical protein
MNYDFSKGNRRSSIVLSPIASDTKPTFSQFNTPATLDVSEDSDGSVAEVSADVEEHTSPTASTMSSPPNAFTNNNVAWFPTLQRTLWILSKLYRCVRVSAVCLSRIDPFTFYQPVLMNPCRQPCLKIWHKRLSQSASNHLLQQAKTYRSTTANWMANCS